MIPKPKFHFDPYDPQFMENPYPAYHRLRSETPIFFYEDWNLWFFTTYEDIATLLGDKRLGRTMDHVISEEEVGQKRKAAHWHKHPYFTRYVRQNFMEKDGVDHARLRKLAHKVFTPVRVRGLENRIQEITDRLLDKVETQTVARFCLPQRGGVAGRVLSADRLFAPAVVFDRRKFR